MINYQKEITWNEYQEDMKESADRAANIISLQKQLLDQKDQLIAALVIAAGGKIEVYESVFCDVKSVVLNIHYMPSTNTYIYKINR